MKKKWQKYIIFCTYLASSKFNDMQLWWNSNEIEKNYDLCKIVRSVVKLSQLVILLLQGSVLMTVYFHVRGGARRGAAPGGGASCWKT